LSFTLHPPDQAAEENKKQEQAASQRRAESADARRQRIAKYERDRSRDHEMMSQLTKAFEFRLIGKPKLRNFNTWLLKATPRAGYEPPNMSTQVLKGMQGQLWIDQKTGQWVKVTAEVIRPVSIEGFLAQVQPGTRFEIEKSPVPGGTWQFTRFLMNSHAKVLFMVDHASQADETYFDYQPVKK